MQFQLFGKLFECFFFSDIFLVVEYTTEGFYPWAGLTLALVILPTLVVEIFSIRWHSLDGNATRTAWLAHFLCLGIAHRYIIQTDHSQFITKIG
jgi:XK-related protein